MLQWAGIFLAIALLSGAFGYGDVAAATAGIAQLLFFIFLFLSAIALVAHLWRGR